MSASAYREGDLARAIYDHYMNGDLYVTRNHDAEQAKETSTAWRDESERDPHRLHRCAACGEEFQPTGRPSACPRCKSEDVFGCESPEDLVEWKLAAQRQRAAKERW